MTWKSYTAASGATVLAGWLASAPPAVVPESRPAPAARSPLSANSGSSDIVEQAERLQIRLRREIEYTQPRRNPFLFEVREQPRPQIESPLDVLPPQAAPVVPAPPAVTLAGVAEDVFDQQVQRTAILSSPSGVLLVREGDEVLGQYRVGVVEGESVELVSLIDGTVRRLALPATTTP